MSLDVYLRTPGVQHAVEAKIYVREGGENREITREEWNARYPDREPYTVEADEGETVYSANITHNLNRMADKAGVYELLWRPEECKVTHAWQLIDLLTDGLARLQSEPDYYRTFNPSNGWGNYDGLVSFVERYLAACREYPDAEVSVSR